MKKGMIDRDYDVPFDDQYDVWDKYFTWLDEWMDECADCTYNREQIEVELYRAYSNEISMIQAVAIVCDWLANNEKKEKGG